MSLVDPSPGSVTLASDLVTPEQGWESLAASTFGCVSHKVGTSAVELGGLGARTSGFEVWLGTSAARSSYAAAAVVGQVVA